MASAAGFVSVSREITESIRKVLDKQSIKFVRAIKQDTRSGKSEDRILVRDTLIPHQVLATWRLYLFAVKVPTKVEVTFNFLEIRAMNTYPEHQVVIDTDKTTYSLRLQTQDQLDHMVSHINYALSRVFNNSIYAPPICRAEGDVNDGSHKFSPNSESSLEPQKTCGGFSETYAALCDYNGIGCKEEVQWDVDTIYHSQDNREFNLQDFSHLDSRDLAVIVASIAYNTWFTKLYCKDMRIGSEVVDQVLHTVSKSNSLEELTLENAGLKSDFPQKMASALSENPASVIHSLNLAHNTLDNQGVSNLIQQVCRLNKGLRLLNLSKTTLSSKGRQVAKEIRKRRARDSLPTFRQFFSSAFSLTHVSLASMKVPPDSLRALFLGLSNNPHITDLHLDISSCELRSAGAGVIQELFPRVSCVGLDADLLAVIPAFSRHPSLKHLMLGKNFNIKGRVLDEIVQKLVHLVQEEECALQSLSLADSRLRQRGIVLVNALGSNACLRKVDLSGNLLEDSGAKMLSKALQINTTLRSVTWDRNNTTATGFQDVARALEHNFTLQYMPLPLSDVTQAHRSAPEKTDQALTKIQRALLRNNQTQRFSQKQALRLHQGLVTSTAEQLYPSLCELAHVLSVDGPVKQRLDTLAGELAKAADKELQVVVDSMVSLCRELCPMSCAAAERLSPPLSSISEQVSIPRSAIRNALMERAAEDINKALEEVKLSVVSYLTNSIVDQILQELYNTHKTLLRQVSQVKRWDDVGTGRRTIRQSRIVESLDFPDEDFGVNLGIHCSENGGVNMLEDGLPDFYSKRVLPDSQLSSLHQAQSLRRKKRRSMLSIFSGFRKNRNSMISNQDSDASENVYSMIQHPRDTARPESTVPGANGTMASPRPAQVLPVQGMRAASPPCLMQRQSTDLVSMVYSCIGAEIEDSDGSSTCDIKAFDQDADRSTTVSDAPAESHTNGHVLSSKQQMDRQMERGRQERIVPLIDSRTETEEDRQSDGGGSGALCGTKSEPPPQSTKPCLAVMRQRHLQESLEEAGNLEGDDQSERKREEKLRARGLEGQRPLIASKPGLDLSMEKTSPENNKTPSEVSPVSAGEEPAIDQRTLPPTQPIIQDKETADRKGPAVSGKLGIEDADFSISQGMERDSPYDLERSSDRRFPVKKPCFPQYRNRSLDYPVGTRLGAKIDVVSPTVTSKD
ncbi:Capping protein, Arp2/3 and myosin-I linker protein 3 [Channa argus]|uniref:Capping protein, Arp2/3 and myosin-I linker protein 3 n=1 Tax=Channa argus TaxID=215402 RepID=A0A6G1Q8J7_CHAAH|nr:Capping protein, Arp2/3 and myosin-I linker protein 3 [Channa argus]